MSAHTPGPGTDMVARLTKAMRAADLAFETVGGSTRHHVRDCLMSALEEERLAVVDVLVPQHLKSAERDVNSLAKKLDAAESVNANLLAALMEAVEEMPVVDSPGCSAWFKRARAAIAKARGGT